MATTGSERGLTLRSPGRFLATADRLDRARAARRADATPIRRCATTSSQAWIDAEAYRWQTFWTVTRIVDGERTGAESSLTKVFWSELDVRLHETALALLGPHAELSTATRGVDEGLRSSRCRARSTRARTRSSAT